MGAVTCDVGVSVDGFVAGPNQSRDEPLGAGAESLHRWMFETEEENGDRGISVAGGASTIDQFALGLIDELRLHIAPLVLGAGERLFAASGPVALRPASARVASLVTHVTYRVAHPPR